MYFFCDGIMFEHAKVSSLGLNLYQKSIFNNSVKCLIENQIYTSSTVAIFVKILK